MNQITERISRIVFTGDVFRTDDALKQNQLGNVRWLSDELAKPIYLATSLTPEIRFRRNEPNGGRLTIEQWYRLLGYKASRQAWAETFWSAKPPPALLEAVRDDYRDALVIGVEISPLLQAMLDSLGVPWVDVTISPIRFLQDLLVSLRFSRHLFHNPAHPGIVRPRDVETGVEHLRRYYRKSDLRQFDEAVVYFAQTPADRTQITRDGQFFFPDATVAAIEAKLKNRRLIVKAHPGAKTHPIISLCQERFDAQVTNENTYAILASQCNIEVLTISSSVGIEAKAFGKQARIFSPDVLDWAYSGPVSLWAHRSPSFWRDLLSPILPTNSQPRRLESKSYFKNWPNILASIRSRSTGTDLEQPDCGNRLRRRLGYFSIERDVWPSRLPKQKHFYKLDEHTRLAMTRSAIEKRRTLVARWQVLDREHTGGWTRRAVEAARMLEQCQSVVDLGCGGMLLEKYLPSGITYVPVDVWPRDARTIVVDLNTQALPDNLKADAVAGLGLLEYLFDVPGLVRACSLRYPTAVFTYNITDAAGALSNRLENAWVNSFSRSELEQILTANGYEIAAARLFDDRQVLWHLRSRCVGSH
jgi:hypothetical protein